MICSATVMLLSVAGALCAKPEFVGRLPHGTRTPNHASLKIINGTTTDISNYPYVASLDHGGNFTGAAVILNNQWLLSTGWITKSVNVTQLGFRVGSSSYHKRGQILKATKVIVHPKYTGKDWDYDIAVVKVDKPIKFGKNVKPIELGTEKLKASTVGLTAGWGYYDTNYTFSETIREAPFTVYDRKKCEKTYGDSLTERLFCTLEKTVGPGYGDFGNPFVKDNKLYGLFAGGDGCHPGKPMLFVDIPSLHKWVQRAIKNDEEQENDNL